MIVSSMGHAQDAVTMEAPRSCIAAYMVSFSAYYIVLVQTAARRNVPGIVRFVRKNIRNDITTEAQLIVNCAHISAK